jgi:hypothetical protein
MMYLIKKEIHTMESKCSICGTPLTKENLDITKILSEKEAKKLYTIRKKRGVCSECSIQMIMLDIV